MKTTLRPYQVAGVRWLKTNPRGLLNDEPRLGKTRQVIVAAYEQGLSPCLVLAGRSYLGVWQEELQTCYPQQRVQVLGDPSQRETQLQQDADWYILTRQALSSTRRFPIMEHLTRHPWQLIVLDEHHHFRNRESKLCKAVSTLHAGHQWALSATPTDGDPRDLWFVLNWLFPKTYGTFWEFSKRYCQFKYNGFGWEYTQPNPKTAQELATRLAFVSLRRTQAEVRPELPPVLEQDIWLDLYPHERQYYREMEQSMLVWLDDQTHLAAPTALAQLTRLRQLASDSYALGSNKPSRKADALAEYILETTRPLVVALEFKAQVDHLAEKLEQQCLVLTGETAHPVDVLRDFRNGRQRVLLFTSAAGGEGVNLSTAEELIIASENWSSIIDTQTRHRLTDLDDLRPKYLTRFVVRNTIEQDVRHLLQKKRKVNAQLLVAELRKAIKRRLEEK